MRRCRASARNREAQPRIASQYSHKQAGFLRSSHEMKAGNFEVTDGPFADTKEMLGGILLLEARDLNHAIALRMSRKAFD